MPPSDPTLLAWWPTTQSLDLVQGPAEAVADAVFVEFQRFAGEDRVLVESKRFCTLDEVFSAAPYFSNAVTFIAVLPTASSWSVLWNNSFLCDGYDSLCWCLTNHHRMTTCHWSAHDAWTTFQTGAGFTHRAWRDGGLIERSVHCSQEDRRWIFAQHGDPLPEEDTSAYSKRKKPDRLNEAGVLALLTKLGAQPWEESFYEILQRPTHLLSRPLPANASARSRHEMLGPDGHGSGLRRPLTGL